MITDQQWASYESDGYLRLGKLLSDTELAEMQTRIDQIMLGSAPAQYDRMLMQLDSDSGRYEDSKEMSKGHKGARLDYRKIQELEFDPIFLSYMQRPIFKDICKRVYGPLTAISCFRAMFMNKPAHKGTFLPWHQDRWSYLDRDPKITLWTALDPATRTNGCVQIIPGSHRRGLINPSNSSGFLTPEMALEHAPTEKVVYLELAAGEVALLHNYLLHGSDVNRTETPRRAFSVCYMEASTQSTTGEQYSIIFGDGALDPHRLQSA